MANITRNGYVQEVKAKATGVVGCTIELDKTLDRLDGRKVRVVVESDEDAAELSATEQRAAWDGWVARSPHGAIEDDGEPEISG